MKRLYNYLKAYSEFQKEIMLVYRPQIKSSWADRCLYLSEDYNSCKPYNHRSVLRNEIVIEFDTEEINRNEWASKQVAELYRRDGIKYSLWKSGNKSTHLHCLIQIKDNVQVNLLKSQFIRYYTQDLDEEPDMRLASDNHLIRAEFGVHEKTGNTKDLIYESKEYAKELSIVNQDVWDKYTRYRTSSLQSEMTRSLNSTAIENLEGFKHILKTETFKELKDGHERALFMLIHILKPKYEGKKEELTKFLQDWYRYSSGYKLTDEDIRRKVKYHWDREYCIGINYLNELLISLGRKDLVYPKDI
jgi:hypothetical protein